MPTTIKELADLVRGQVQGNGELLIAAARPLDEAASGDITFLENARHAHLLHSTKASAAVVPQAVPLNGVTLIRVDDPLSAFVTIVRHLQGRPEPGVHGIDPLASVHPTTRIGADASILPFAVVGEGSVLGARCRLHSGAVVGRNCRLGDDVVLYPHVVLYDDVVLGNRVIVHGNAVIGADGFGFRLSEGRHAKVPQLGHVEIGDDVEIGAGTTIDRGTFKATRVGCGTKIDNLVQIGHNCDIGRHNLLVSHVAIGGSCSTGDYVVLAGQVGVVDHVRIGHRAIIAGQSGITRDVADGQRMFGSPANPERLQKRIIVTLEKLPEMRRDLERIKRHFELPDE